MAIALNVDLDPSKDQWYVLCGPYGHISAKDRTWAALDVLRGFQVLSIGHATDVGCVNVAGLANKNLLVFLEAPQSVNDFS